MQSRFLKQFIYGSVYVIIFGGIAYGGYVSLVRSAPTCFDNRQNQGEIEVDCGGPSCEDCAIKKLQPIAVLGSPEILSVTPQQSSLFMKIRNPNQDFGAEFSYTIKIYDADEVLMRTIASDAFIYPAQIKSFAEPALPVEARRVGHADVTISNVRWQKGSEFVDPGVTTRGLKTVVTGNQAKTTGLVANSNGYAVSKVNVITVLYNEIGFRVSVSKTSLENIAPFEERAFTVNAAFSGKIDPAKTEVYVEARR